MGCLLVGLGCGGPGSGVGGSPGGVAPWLARGPLKTGLTASIEIIL